jgi:transposase-like protein
MELKFRSLQEFNRHFSDENACLLTLEAIRFEKGRYCPRCGCSSTYKFRRLGRYRCRKCRRDFSAKTGTVFEETKLPLKKWMAAIFLLTNSKSSVCKREFARAVGVTAKTANSIAQRLHQVTGRVHR